MDYKANGDGTYTISCTSTGSPPSTVFWTRNKVNMTNSDKYIPSQRVIDGSSSTYDNVLTIKGSYEDAVGDYTCNISNAFWNTSKWKTINGSYFFCD